MKLYFFMFCVLCYSVAFGQIETVSLSSSCNNELDNPEQLKCWSQHFTIYDDIVNMISDSLIESTKVSEKSLKEIVVDIKLKNNRPSLLNGHIYFIKHGENVSFLNSDTLYISGSNIYSLFTLKGKVILEKYKMNKNIVLLYSKILWENNDCEIINIDKTLRSINSSGKKYKIKLFIINDCLNTNRFITKSI